MKSVTYKTRGGEIVTVQTVAVQSQTRAAPKPLSLCQMTKTELIADGWTRTLIKKYLGAPDAVQQKRTRFYGGSYEIHFYAVSRIREAEARADWQRDAQLARQRRETGKSIATRQREAVLAAVQDVRIRVASVPNLREAAIKHYNARQTDRVLAGRADSDVPSADADAPTPFLDRIMVNFARHCLTRYDATLRAIDAKRVNGETKQRAKLIFRKRVLAAIAQEYPELAHECARQTWREGTS